MSTEYREFRNLDELLKFIDAQIDELRRKLGELLRRVEEARIRAEQERKLRELLSKVLGTNVATGPSIVELKSIKLLVNPSAEAEITMLEQLAEAINSKIMMLQAVRKDLEVLSGVELVSPIRVVVIDGIPRGIIIKI